MARTEEQKRKHREYMREWTKTEKGKAYKKAYAQRPEVKERKKLHQRARRTKQSQQDVDKFNSYKRRWYKNNPDKIREYQRRYWFGLEESDYQRLLDEQNHRCYLCDHKFTIRGRGTTAGVDHNHENGIIRGLLCMQCNTALGRVEKWSVEKLLVYLKRDTGFKHRNWCCKQKEQV